MQVDKNSGGRSLLLVRDFSAAVLEGWERNVASQKPSADSLDRYFMMYGKSLKNRGGTNETS